MKIPLSFWSKKLSAMLSTIMVFSIGLPILDKSLRITGIFWPVAAAVPAWFDWAFWMS
jgi:hypothetical protein